LFLLEDGRITPNEQMEMACARTALGLNEEDAKKIFAHIAREEFHKKGVCPHCQKSLHNRRSGDK
jgi:hypothetical protein